MTHDEALAAERAWWDSLEGDEITNNTAGFPPYDVDDVVMIIDKYINDLDADILDLGCGTGRLTERYAEMSGCDVWGVDIAPSLILEAQRLSRAACYQVGDGRNIPADLRFGHAYSVTMFQHIPHEAKWDYIMQVWRRLPVGGRFVFTVSVGDEPNSFLNFQIHSIASFGTSLASLFDTVEISPLDERGWTWVLCQK